MKDYQVTSSFKPCKDRQEAVKLLESICSSKRVSNVQGSGPMLLSDIPDSCRKCKASGGVILGIDEAGRGPVLGPMTYGCAFWNPADEHLIPKGFTDSKQLDKNTRSSLFSSIQACPSMGFVLRVLHASEISRSMLRAEPYNLNAMSHDSAMDMIQAVLDAGVEIDTAYIDTVGIADSYKMKLEREFQKYNIKFVVEKKADANYSPCSAASVIAKVARDSIVENWNWSEPGFEPEDGRNYGSGYPSDPTCKNWMEKNLTDDVFCFPDFVRFSWGPAKSAVKEKGAKVEWKAEEEDENGEKHDANQMKMNMFLQSVTKNNNPPAAQSRKRRRFDYFDKLKLSTVSEIVKM